MVGGTKRDRRGGGPSSPLVGLRTYQPRFPSPVPVVSSGGP